MKKNKRKEGVGDMEWRCEELYGNKLRTREGKNGEEGSGREWQRNGVEGGSTKEIK